MREFKTVDWAHHTNIYEVNIRQYTSEGTINAFAKHLPRLKEMGVHTLWLMPITPISEKNKKGSRGSYYACASFKLINPEFGTHDDFKSLVAKAHQMGFKLIIDWVANHTGWDHIWTNQHPDYYLHDENTGDFKMPNAMADIIELDYGNSSMRTDMIDAMKYWVEEFDIDGFRCDLASWVVLDFWKQARPVLEKIKPLFWLGEFDELEKPEYGEVFDASYSWTWMHKTGDFYKKKLSLESLFSYLKNYDDLGDNTMRCWFTSNHDENSWNGTEFEKYGDMAKALAVFSFTWNGIPLVYSGQEIPNMKRLKFFDKDDLEWKVKNEMEEFYRILLELKNTNPALQAGDPSVQTFRIKTNQPQGIFAYLRKKEEHEALVVLNLSDQRLKTETIDPRINGKYESVFDKSEFKNQFESGPWQFFVFKRIS